MRYRRILTPGAHYFLTINLQNRKSNLLIEHVSKLKFAFKTVRQNHPFDIDAIVILPDHYHMIMSLPPDDANYSKRLNLIKGLFSRQIELNEPISISRRRKRERGIWQRRFWEHMIKDTNDYERHVNYIHYNPVKHGYVKKPSDWKCSSIHRFIRAGIVSEDWASLSNLKTFGFGE